MTTTSGKTEPRIHTYPEPLVEARLIKRYKRFLCDLELADSGRLVTALCPNSGSMKGCLEPGSRAMLSTVPPESARKTRYTLELLKPGRSWVGVNTHLSNRLARRIIEAGLVPELAGWRVRRAEVSFSGSRLDFLLERESGGLAWLEVKNVTLRAGGGGGEGGGGRALFPDAQTARGRRHLGALLEARRRGQGAFVLYTVQRADCNSYAPAVDIDPLYARAEEEARAAGVRVFPCFLRPTPRGIFWRFSGEAR